MGDKMKINLPDPVPKKYLAVAYYLDYAIEGLARVEILSSTEDSHHIEIYDTTDEPNVSHGEFTCPVDWIELAPVVLNGVEYCSKHNIHPDSLGAEFMSEHFLEIKNIGRLERDLEFQPLGHNLKNLFNFINKERFNMSELLDLLRSTESIFREIKSLTKDKHA
jgi:hypothetical protein